MKISTETFSIAKIVGIEKTFEYIAKAGFDAFDFTLFEMAKWDRANGKIIFPQPLPEKKKILSYLKKLKKISTDCGLICNQAHAPFPSLPLIEYVEFSIECASLMGAELIVVHPDNNLCAEKNAEMYFKLLSVAKKCGIKIATENMFNRPSGNATFAACSTAEDFIAHLNAVNDEYFVACLDIGHAEIFGEAVSAPQMIRALAGKLQALHLHDNDKRYDLHQLPFTKQIDFYEIAKALKEINYNGYLTLEANNYLSGRTEENLLEGVIDLANSARKIERLITE